MTKIEKLNLEAHLNLKWQNTLELINWLIEIENNTYYLKYWTYRKVWFTTPQALEMLLREFQKGVDAENNIVL